MPGASSPVRVLVAEDDFVIGLELEAGLAEAGFEVVGVARSAQQALVMALAERPALAVMDIRLAGRGDGVEAAIDIYRATGVRAIFATANQDAEVMARAAAARPLAWIGKPYQVEVLARLIGRVLADAA
ncbi:MAG TPA: response regulator [Caulobacteraceae bacterium]|nr:response regulator [Caulobacteraceae bacterium]